MAQFSVPASPKVYSYQTEQFQGADFTSDSGNVQENMSPNCVNIIRSVPGRIRKRKGYKQIADYGACVYGVHELSSAGITLLHAGNKLYNFSERRGTLWSTDKGEIIQNHEEKNVVLLTGTPTDTDSTIVYEGMAEHRSMSLQLNNKLLILDGKQALIFDGNEVRPLSEVAYVPLLTISKDPSGGGEPTEPLNLLQPAFEEQFVVTEDTKTAKDFCLSFAGLDDTTVQAWLLDGNGEWIEKHENTDFTVNRETGVVTFVTAPGQSPVRGEDNVKVRAYRTVEGYADRINHCTIGTLFGVNGANDRIFVSGNPDFGKNEQGELYSFINYDWFSEIYDPTYFGDTNYSRLGSDGSAIMGYTRVNNYLAAHKDKNETEQSILIREGDMIDSDPAFKLINSLQGAGAISKYCFSYLATEPMFLSELGIYAVTAQDITGEKYAQDRSYYLEGKLMNEPGLEDAFAFTWKDMYFLCVNDHVYVLDGLQPLHTDKSRPYATRQYAGFYLENIPAKVMWRVGDDLFFGSKEGKVYQVYADEKSIASYNDNGKAIPCSWETSDISEDKFYKNKTYRYIAIRCMPEPVSSVDIYAQKNGLWENIKADNGTLRYLSFKNITFSKMTFSTNSSQKITSTKMRIKKVDHVRFRFENNQVNEPLGINAFACEYSQGNNIKK